MQQLSISIDQLIEATELAATFSKKHLKAGDRLNVQSDFAQLGVLVLLGQALHIHFKKAKKDSTNSVLKAANANALEGLLEGEYGIDIDVQPAESSFSTDPIDALFGLWENRDISLESIRNQAWRVQN